MIALLLLLILAAPALACPTADAVVMPAAATPAPQTVVTCPSLPCTIIVMPEAPTATETPTAAPSGTPTPTVAPSPSPTAAPASPSPTATAAPACIQITSPAANTNVTGTIPIGTTDNCPGLWFESLAVDGQHVADFPPGKVTLNTAGYSNGPHTVSVFAQTINPGSQTIGGCSVNLLFGTPPPSPVPASSPVPPAAHFGNVGPQSRAGPVSSDAACTVAANSSAFPETNPLNLNDGTGWNSNNQIWTTPAYFYANAGRNGLAPAADFASVDGDYAGSTQDIIRWAACKWGVDEDWAYAESNQEHGWQQSCAQMHGGTGCMAGGDCNNPDSDSGGETPGLTFMGYPVTNSASTFVGINGLGQSNGVQSCSGNWASWGIIQSKVGNFEWYTWPMIALSTAWNEDYRWAKWRACMDGDYAGWFGQNQDYLSAVSAAQSTPGGPTAGSAPKYLANETNLQYLALGCLAAHFSGQWYDSSAQNYASSFVSTYLNPKNWPGQMGHKRK